MREQYDETVFRTLMLSYSVCCFVCLFFIVFQMFSLHIKNPLSGLRVAFLDVFIGSYHTLTV